MTEIVYGSVISEKREPIMVHWWHTVDRVSLAFVLGLFGIGVLLGLAASPPLAAKNGYMPLHYVNRQLAFGVLAITVMFLFSMLSPKMIRRIGVIGFLLSFIALAFLPIFGTDFGKGSIRWYSLGFSSLQPSEFLKPFFVIITAWLISVSFEINGPPGKAISFLIAILVSIFLVIQPDFGQASLILASWGMIYFVAGAPLLLLLIVAISIFVAGIFAYSISEHFARRIDGFLSVKIDPNTQIGYATNAIQEGGIFGVGVGEGIVKNILPDAHTDFIIAVAAEEYGLLFVLLIIFIYLTITIRSLFRLIRERNTFIRLAGTGLAVLFASQALINLGVAVRLLPAKGMTLPFISYGGSSLLAGGIALGMLLAFTRERAQGAIGDVIGQNQNDKQKI
jgi:cell division protein FtsW